MAEEEKSGFRNTRLLLVAGGLGLLFLLLFNYQSYMQRTKLEKETVEIARIVQDLQPGDVLTEQNTRPEPIPGRLVGGLKGFVPYSDLQARFGIEQVKMPVPKNTYLQYEHIGVITSANLPNQNIPDAFQVIPLEVKAVSVPTPFVSPNTRVDVYGVLSLSGESADVHLIIESVRIASVGGEAEGASKRTDVRTVAVHVPTDLVQDLLKVIRRTQGPLYLAARGAGEKADRELKYPYKTDRAGTWWVWGGRIAPDVANAIKAPFSPPAGAVSGDLSGWEPGR